MHQVTIWSQRCIRRRKKLASVRTWVANIYWKGSSKEAIVKQRQGQGLRSLMPRGERRLVGSSPTDCRIGLKFMLVKWTLGFYEVPYIHSRNQQIYPETPLKMLTISFFYFLHTLICIYAINSHIGYNLGTATKTNIFPISAQQPVSTNKMNGAAGSDVLQIPANNMSSSIVSTYFSFQRCLFCRILQKCSMETKEKKINEQGNCPRIIWIEVPLKNLQIL